MEYKPLPVSDDLMEETFGAANAIVNRFIVSSTPDLFRIAFGESRLPNSKIHWRVALSMKPAQAAELRDVLNSLLKPFEEDAARRAIAEALIRSGAQNATESR